MRIHMLLVAHDASFADTLTAMLQGSGHAVTVAADARAALVAVAGAAFDAVLVDRALPGTDGIALLRRLRADGMTLPIVLLDPDGQSADRIAGLDAGADDHVARDVPVDELVARIAALLRGRRWAAGGGDTLRAGDILVSPSRLRAWRDGRALDLTRLEFRLLHELVRGGDAVLSRATLLERVWGYDHVPATNIVDVQIRYLRAKLMTDGGGDPIVAVRGVGYRLRG